MQLAVRRSAEAPRWGAYHSKCYRENNKKEIQPSPDVIPKALRVHDWTAELYRSPVFPFFVVSERTRWVVAIRGKVRKQVRREKTAAAVP